MDLDNLVRKLSKKYVVARTTNEYLPVVKDKGVIGHSFVKSLDISRYVDYKENQLVILTREKYPVKVSCVAIDN